MFKKTMMAAAVMAMSASAMSATWAPEFATTAAKHGKEGITGVLDAVGVVASSGGAVRLGTQYYVGDLVTFTYSTPIASANVFPTVFKSAITGTAANLHQTSGTCSAVGTCLTERTATDGGVGEATATTVINIGDRFSFASTPTIPHTVQTIDTTDGTITYLPVSATARADDDVMTFIGLDTIEFGKQSETANSVTYRIGAITQSVAAAGRLSTRVNALVPAPEVKLTAAGLLAANATVKFSSVTAAGVALESISAGVSIATTIAESPITIGKFNAIVDVAQDNKGFVGLTSTTSSDALTFTFTPGTKVNGTTIDSTTALGLLTPEAGATAATWNTQSAVHTIDGDFDFLDDAATAGVTSSDITSDVGTVALATTGDKFTVTDTGISTKVITLLKDTAATVIPVQNFSGKSVVSYKNNSNVDQVSTTTHASLGGFTLNGATVQAYGVPMGSTVSRFLWISNKGATAATASATVMAGGVSYGPYAVGTIAAKDATSFAPAIDAALAAAGVVLPQNSRATITITAPLAQANVELSAAYKHIGDADRLTVETSDSLN